MSSPRDIINTAWPVYFYPVLGQVKLGWVAAEVVITLSTRRLRQMNCYLQISQELSSQNVMHPIYVSLEFSSEAPGDGDVHEMQILMMYPTKFALMSEHKIREEWGVKQEPFF